MTSGVDWKSAPEDYAAFHRIYYPYMVNLVAKNGIDDNNKEDVASDIFARLIEKGFLEQFDPDLVFEYNGSLHPARFKSFLARAVTVYVRGYYDKQKRLATREVLLCDVPIAGKADGYCGVQDSWADVYGTPNPDHADDILDLIVEEQDAAGIRRWLSNRPRRSMHDACDLVELYDAVRTQLLDIGEYDVKKLQVQFQLSTTTMHSWLWWLKSNLAVAYGLPVPAKRRRTVRKAAS